MSLGAPVSRRSMNMYEQPPKRPWTCRAFKQMLSVWLRAMGQEPPDAASSAPSVVNFGGVVVTYFSTQVCGITRGFSRGRSDEFFRRTFDGTRWLSSAHR